MVAAGATSDDAEFRRARESSASGEVVEINAGNPLNGMDRVARRGSFSSFFLLLEFNPRIGENGGH